MGIESVDYPTPVQVRGFSCRNCSEVDMANKNIDPAHPRSGVGNVNAASDPSRNSTDPEKIAAAKRAADKAGEAALTYSTAGSDPAAIPAGMAFTIFA